MIVVTRTITCDRCGDWLDLGDITTREMRRIAKRRGWKVSLPGGQDVCPDAAKHERLAAVPA